MTRRGTGLYGLPEILRLIEDSDLPRPDARVLSVLARRCRWEDGGEIHDSLPEIARRSKYSASQTRKILKRLEASTVLEVTERSNGGWGRTNKRRINLEVLRRRASGGEAAFLPQSGVQEPRSSAQRMVYFSAKNPLVLDPSNEEGKKSPYQPRQRPQLGPHSPGGPPDPGTGAGGISAAEADQSARLLREIGVTLTKPAQLASRHRLEEIKVAIAEARGMGSRCHDLAAMIVHKLQNGEAKQLCERRRRRVGLEQRRQRVRWRAEQVRAMQVALNQFRGKPEEPSIRSDLQAMGRRWKNDDCIAECAAIPDHVFELAENDPRQMLAELAQRARCPARPAAQRTTMGACP